MKKIFIVLALCVLLFVSTVQSYSFTYSTKENPNLTSTSHIQTITIFNPYKDIDFKTINHYKANLHTHTTESDGSSTPAEVIYHYHDIGNYDILAITDHNKNTWPWSDYIIETPLESSSSSEYYPDLEMLALSGNEMSLRHHRNSLLNDYSRGGFFLNLAFWFLQQQQGLSFFNHPGRYNHREEWYQRFFDRFDDTVLGIEVYNQGDRYEDDRLLWDQINKDRNPDDLIWGFSNDDMHNISKHCFRNYQHFLMNELTESEFRCAMVNGAFYFSYEPNGADNGSKSYGKAITPKLIDVTITGSIIQLTTEASNSVQWIDQDSQIIAAESTINVSTSNSNFVRAVLTNEYGKTYTQPFGLEITSSFLE